MNNLLTSTKKQATHTLQIDRTNASGLRMVRTESRTLDDWNDYFGQAARNISSLISRVNKDYAARYANNYVQCCYVTKVPHQPNSVVTYDRSGKESSRQEG